MNFSTILLERISHHLLRRGETISICENVTSGALQLAFSQMPDAENFYNGGLTIFNHSQLKWLNWKTDADQIFKSRNGAECLSVEVARQFSSDWSIAITGCLSSKKEEFGNQIFAYYSISYKNFIIKSDRIDLHPLTKVWDAQKYFAEYVLTCLRCELKHEHFSKEKTYA